MKIALDYDNCYNADKRFWDKFIEMSLNAGHEVYIVTARHPEKDYIGDKVHWALPILYCNGVAKKWFCHHNFDIDFDIWIDDKPEGIVQNSSASKEVLEEWRKSEAWSK